MSEGLKGGWGIERAILGFAVSLSCGPLWLSLDIRTNSGKEEIELNQSHSFLLKCTLSMVLGSFWVFGRIRHGTFGQHQAIPWRQIRGSQAESGLEGSCFASADL